MHVNFNSLQDYRDFLYSEFENVSGSGESFGDRFTQGVRKFATLTDDLSLDDSLIDLEDLA